MAGKPRLTSRVLAKVKKASKRNKKALAINQPVAFKTMVKTKKTKSDTNMTDLKKIVTEEHIQHDSQGRIVKKTTTVTEFINPDKPVRPRDKTQVIFVLDSSSSMQTGKDLTINGFNEQIKAIKDSNGGNTDVEVSLVIFSDLVSTTIRHSELGAVAPLSLYTYNPMGNTALYDGIGAAINLAEEKGYASNTKNAVLIAIFTDGEENCSKTYNQGRLKEIITNRIARGNWTFSVLGPRYGLNNLRALGIPEGNIAGFTPESIVSRGWTNSLNSAHVHNYFAGRAMGSASVHDSYFTATASVGADPSLSKNVIVSPINLNIDPVKIGSTDNSWPLPAKTAVNSLADTDKETN